VYTWTEEKHQLNTKNHGLYLSEIVEVFDDTHLIEWYDRKHSSIEEDRFICLGKLRDTIMLFVVFTEQGEDIHLISARKAEPIEERLYNAHYERETRGN
jgi:uncharacterized DUF497 family protein